MTTTKREAQMEFQKQRGIYDDMQHQVKEAVKAGDFASVETYYRWYGDYLTMKPEAVEIIGHDGGPTPGPIVRGTRVFTTRDEKVRHLPA